MNLDEELQWLDGEILYYDNLPPDRTNQQTRMYLAKLKARREELLAAKRLKDQQQARPIHPVEVPAAPRPRRPRP